ncbi:MAG: hypothetical protein Q4E17_06525, partial [Synergistes sp.]|nr:hypothetical protein [Synergistes sp.]
ELKSEAHDLRINLNRALFLLCSWAEAKKLREFVKFFWTINYLSVASFSFIILQAYFGGRMRLND